MNNCSDFPAVCVPTVDSSTLGTRDKLLYIPPRSSLQTRFEYVAKTINTEYRRGIVFRNLLNSDNTIEVEVLARNIDINQVLLHSQYYKVNTRNTKREQQVFFDACLYDVPNIKLFSIENISSNEVHLSLTSEAISPACEIRLFKYSDEPSSEKSRPTPLTRSPSNLIFSMIIIYDSCLFYDNHI